MAIAQEEKAALRGHPSYVWRFGQERRLALVRRYVPLEGRRVLDIGCGLGIYVRKFQELSEGACGIDVEFDRVREGAKFVPNLMVARGEDLPYRDGSFDVVFLNEVLEHVEDDRQTLREASRVLRPGGHVVIFAPNRLYFFETHGFYLGKRFVFRLLPLVNWLPDALRRIFVPQVRAYLAGDLERLWRGLPLRQVAHSYVYPGFDNIVHRRPQLGGLLRRVFYLCEATPLRVFGLSHFLVLQKTQG
ncbi:MAG: class I SAM-dependent methyltransferase [Chloroflexi bacterium]|nr:class I SAM-dependent methyltransferase [Chloroflexota bacterium]